MLIKINSYFCEAENLKFYSFKKKIVLIYLIFDNTICINTQNP